MLFIDVVKNFLDGIDDEIVYDEIFDNYLNQINCNGVKCNKCLPFKKNVRFFINMHKRQGRIKKSNDEFWAAVFHDVKSPMLSINFALRGALTENKKDDEILTDVYNLNLKNLNFIQELLDAYQFELGVHFYETEIVNLKKILIKLAADYKYFLKEKDLTINLENVEDGLIVECNTTEISRLFSNLISNAVKFAPVDSEIMVKGREIGTEVLITIENRGEKIEEGAEKMIFEKFKKTGNGKNPTHSSGLGLYICSAIVKKANGKIWAKNLEDGVRFSVVLKAHS